MVRESSHVAVTREGAVGALKLLMIVLAAVIFWESASAVNIEFHNRGFTTAPAFVKGAARLLTGMETPDPFRTRIVEFWHRNHHLLALIVTMAAAVVLSTRYLILGRVLDFLYLESAVRDKRVYSGFVANIFLVLVHAGIIYGIVLVGRDNHASIVPLMVLVLFLFNLLWSGGLYLTSRPLERHALRGLKFLALTSGISVLLLFTITWFVETVPVKDEALRGSKLMILGAGLALALCIADAFVQTFIYCRRFRPAPPAA